MANIPEENKPSVPEDKQDLLDRIEREWSALMSAFEKLDLEQASKPGPGAWSAKDNLAHLAAWERFMLLYHLQGIPAYEAMQIERAVFEQLDEDGINGVLYERNRSRPLPEILEDSRSAHDQVLKTLEQMTFEDMLKQRYSDDPEARPVLAWIIGNTYEHYQEHRQAIEAILVENY